MVEIYVSSTYEDLERHRRAVRDVIRKLGHTDVAMEYYVAENERPLTRCIQDVRRCEVYIGIFAWRYGYVPPGESRSITELEYREATKCGKRILLFVSDANYAWPSRLVDGGQSLKRITALRSEILGRSTCGTFETPQSLAVEVATAIAKVGHLVSTPLDYEREDRLINVWRDASDPAERNRARAALVHMASPRFVAILKDLALGGLESTATFTDIEDLIRLCEHNSELLAVFRGMLRYGDAGRRSKAVFSVGELALRGFRPTEAIIDMLVEQAVDDDRVVRREVAHALGKVRRTGYASQAVVGALRKLTGDTDEIVVRMAKQALSN